MKLFWSWQSDTPGKMGRHFIRDALDSAVAQLKDTPELVEPSERETLDALEVDQDRQAISGSTDLAPEIRKKIANCDVFIADVTSVGVIDPVIVKLNKPKADPAAPAVKHRRTRRKRLINSNVAIELGYAYESVGDNFVLLVMNDHFGSHEDMPFDLRHKGATVTFTLAPDSDAAERARVQKALTKRLVTEIKLCLSGVTQEKASLTPFAAAAETRPGLYFTPSEISAEGGEPGEQPFHFRANAYCYLRFHPRSARPPVGLQKMMEVFDGQRMVTLSHRQYPIPRRNRFGAIGFEGAGTRIDALIQGFPSGELWGVNGDMIREHNLDGRATLVIPSIAVEKAFIKALTNYVAVATRVLGQTPPFSVTMGVAGIEKALLSAPGGPLNKGQYLGPIYDAEVRHTAVLTATDDGALRSVLRDFFIKLWDAAAASRAYTLTEELIAGHDLPPR